MLWVLIFWTLSDAPLIIPDFTSEQQCQAAATRLVQAANRRPPATFACIARGGK